MFVSEKNCLYFFSIKNKFVLWKSQDNGNHVNGFIKEIIVDSLDHVKQILKQLLAAEANILSLSTSPLAQILKQLVSL